MKYKFFFLIKGIEKFIMRQVCLKFLIKITLKGHKTVLKIVTTTQFQCLVIYHL